VRGWGERRICLGGGFPWGGLVVARLVGGFGSRMKVVFVVGWFLFPLGSSLEVGGGVVLFGVGRWCLVVGLRRRGERGGGGE